MQEFKDILIHIEGLTDFSRKVYEACCSIPAGQTISYGKLSELIGKHGAARAVGGTLGKNPIPLIIPCHRVISSNGGIGGFSAMGGTELKKKLLTIERYF